MGNTGLMGKRNKKKRKKNRKEKKKEKKDEMTDTWLMKAENISLDLESLKIL